METFNEVIMFILKEVGVKEFPMLHDIFSTFQATNVDCEQEFILMNLTKLKMRDE